ncbi:hypothetical protein [Nocardia harenae]|nr:hypothetical protein [Nocardia harenae]
MRGETAGLRDRISAELGVRPGGGERWESLFTATRHRRNLPVAPLDTWCR